MFDLEQSMADWRAEMLRDGRCAQVDLAELEEHLREAMAKLSRSGLAQEEAFLLAVRRLGGTDQLKLEYGKTYPERVWRERAVWMLVGLLAWPAILAVPRLMGVLGLIAATSIGATKGWLIGASISMDLFGWAGGIGLAWFVYRQAVRGRIGRRPGLWIASAVSVILVGELGEQFGVGIEAHLIPVRELGHVMMVRAIWGFGLSIMVPIAFWILALRLTKKTEMENC